MQSMIGTNSSQSFKSGSSLKVKTPGSLWVWLLVGLTFLPYFAIPVGENTNVPISSIVALLIAPKSLAMPRLFVGIQSLLMGAPLVAAFAVLLASGESANIAPLVTWVLYAMPFSAMAVIAFGNPRALVAPLRVFLVFSASFALVQKFLFIDKGTLPFISYYRMPGYASVESNLPTILTYIKRPFGLFPEPSFLAGSLALATLSLIAVVYAVGEGVRRLDVYICLLSILVIYLSKSGSAIPTCVLILVALYWPRTAGLRRLTVICIASATGLFVGASILLERNSVNNWSWADRATSLVGAFRFMFADPIRMLVGVGRGESAALFQSGDIPLSGLAYSHVLSDIYSVTGRVIFENGVVFGGSAMVALCVFIFLGSRELAGRVVAWSFLAGWLVVGTITTSYDSAAWIWAMPGILTGLHFRQRERLGSRCE